jgi:hypothetical protein
LVSYLSQQAFIERYVDFRNFTKLSSDKKRSELDQSKLRESVALQKMRSEAGVDQELAGAAHLARRGWSHLIAALVLKELAYFNYAYPLLSQFIERGKTIAREYKEEKSRPSKEETIERWSQFITDVARQWLYYNKHLKFKEGVPLVSIIRSFTCPITEFTQKFYPDVVNDRNIFLGLLISGIQASGYPSKKELDEAIEALGKMDLTQWAHKPNAN